MNFIKMKNQIELHFWVYLIEEEGESKKGKNRLLKNPHLSTTHHLSRLTTLKGPECAFLKITYFQNNT